MQAIFLTLVPSNRSTDGIGVGVDLWERSQACIVAALCLVSYRKGVNAMPEYSIIGSKRRSCMRCQSILDDVVARALFNVYSYEDC